MKSSVVIGLGNPLMSDEGIGVHIVGALSERGTELPGFDFMDLGTSGAKLLHAIAGRKRAYIIDCAFLGREPGAMVRFEPDEVVSNKACPRLSLHEGDVLGTIELSRRLGECPGVVVIFGIQPEKVEPGESLSDTLSSRLDYYVEQIAAELAGSANA